jgi:hypothetical protein
MSDLKLSDLKPEDVQVDGQTPAPANSGLKLSDLSSDDVQPTEQPTDKSKDWSKTQAFGQGALQGGTAGFSDEIGGVEGALQEKLLNALPGAKTNDSKSITDLYKEYRDLHRSRNKESEEAQPVANFAGNVTGAVTSSLLAPGILGAKTIAGAAGLGAAAGLGTSDADLTNSNAQNIEQAVKDTAIGGTLGAVAGKIGQKLGSALNPEELETAGSKLASEAVGIKPSKELTRVFNKETGQMVEGSNTIKGIGKTAMEENALPMTGGPSNIYDKSLDAINHNYDKMNPLISQTQEKLDTNLPQYLDESGHIGDKAANFLYEFRNGLSQDPDQNAIMKKIEDKYMPYIEKLTQSDGNLQELNQFKRALQDKATDLSAAAYSQPASDLKPEAEFVKRLGGIVRQHIEDVATAADSNAGDQISNINKTLGNLYTYRNAAKKLMDKSFNGSLSDVKTGVAVGAGALAGGPIGGAIAGAAKLGLESSTGHPVDRLVKMASARLLNKASKVVQTPIGEIAQKVVSDVPLATVSNPFTQGQIQKKYDVPQPSRVATNLYNATDDSLKNVANQFKQTPGLSSYAEPLNKAIDANDVGAKNRAIFLIMQNPMSRKLVTPNKK